MQSENLGLFGTKNRQAPFGVLQEPFNGHLGKDFGGLVDAPVPGFFSVGYAKDVLAHGAFSVRWFHDRTASLNDFLKGAFRGNPSKAKATARLAGGQPPPR